MGKAVVAQLLEAGIKVRVIGRNSYPELIADGVDCVQGSITDSEVISKAVSGMDIVFHVAALAGIWGPWQDYYDVNVTGTKNVITACRVNNVKALIYTSTPSVVFNREDIVEGDEDLPYASDFLCNYAETKVIAEKEILTAASDSLKTCAIRPHLIWGPEDPHLVPRLIDRGKKKMLKQVGQGNNLVDISYVDNVAYAHILAARNLLGSCTANGNAYFISQEKPVNLWNWVNELFEKLDVPQVKSNVSSNTAFYLGWFLESVYRTFRLKGEPRMTRFLSEQLSKSHYFSISRAKRDLGYEELVSTEEGLRRTIAWFKE